MSQLAATFYPQVAWSTARREKGIESSGRSCWLRSISVICAYNLHSDIDMPHHCYTTSLQLECLHQSRLHRYARRYKPSTDRIYPHLLIHLSLILIPISLSPFLCMLDWQGWASTPTNTNSISHTIGRLGRKRKLQNIVFLSWNEFEPNSLRKII